jgi:Rieske [2Fe-2S] domain
MASRQRLLLSTGPRSQPREYSPQLPPFPSSWYCVGWSDELPPGAVRTQRIAGQQIVLFRTRAGQAAAVEAHCSHMGAHLGRRSSSSRPTPRKIYEISRLTSAGRTDLLVVASLLPAVLQYAYVNRFTVGLAIVKPLLLKVVNGRLGVPTRPVREHAVLEHRAGVFAPYLLKPLLRS